MKFHFDSILGKATVMAIPTSCRERPIPALRNHFLGPSQSKFETQVLIRPRAQDGAGIVGAPLAKVKDTPNDPLPKCQGVVKDEVEAVKWYRKATEQNYARAQFNLGLCYANGHGVVKDEVEAYRWFLLAAAQGDEDAKTNISIAERRLTREQIAEGQKRAASAATQK
jgi:hypothetical protein